MPITDLIPWKKNDQNIDIRRVQNEDSLLELRSQMNRLFDDVFERPFSLSPFVSNSSLMGNFAPLLDVSESDKEIKISAELPGMEPEDIHITLDHNTLTISGEKRAEKEEKGKHHYRIERSYGSFRRSIPLLAEVQEDKIDATFKRGVLKIKLPKIKLAQAKSKRIEIKTG